MKVSLLLTLSSVIAGAACAAENRNEKIKYLDSFLLAADRLFSLEGKNQCQDKLLCLLETGVAGGINNTLKYISRFLTNANQDTSPSDFNKVQSSIHKYPHVSKIVDAIKLGQSAKHTDVCSTTFSACQADASDFISAARIFDNRQVTMQERSNPGCSATDAVCNTATVACGLCGIFTFGLCTLACAPEVEVGCGLIGVTCAILDGPALG